MRLNLALPHIGGVFFSGKAVLLKLVLLESGAVSSAPPPSLRNMVETARTLTLASASATALVCTRNLSFIFSREQEQLPPPLLRRATMTGSALSFLMRKRKFRTSSSWWTVSRRLRTPRVRQLQGCNMIDVHIFLLFLVLCAGRKF